jgi:hypothetical protein
MDQRDRDVLRASRARQASGKHLGEPIAGQPPPALLRLLLGFVALLLVTTTARELRAAEAARLVPTGIEATPGRYSPAAASQDEEVRRRGAAVDQTVAEALEDMGLEVVASAENAPADGDLPQIARGGWAFAPRLELRPGGAILRVVAVTPGSRVLFVREEDLEGNELRALSVRTVVMVRDLVEAGRSKDVDRQSAPKPSRVHRPPPRPLSPGRSVLALNATLLGGYLGYTMQRASGSPNSRLVYPMVALGAGLGLGASLLVADEWNIGEGDAWYLAAGIYWPGASGFLIADSYGKKVEQRYLYGLLGATTGVGLGTLALATGKLSEGGAVLTHSGGAFGMLFGAMTEVAIDPDTEGTPTRGMGFGAGVGVLAAGIAATQVEISASRMLLVDLSVTLGGLGGAALASPLLFVEESNPTHTRLWLGAVAGGAVAGGFIGWYFTDSDDKEASAFSVVPYATRTPSPYGDSFDVGLMGTF